MIKYTLYTEDRVNLPELVSKHFQGYTIQKALGVWKGVREFSVSIVIMSDVYADDKVLDLVNAIKLANEQEAVMVETQAVQVAFI